MTKKTAKIDAGDLTVDESKQKIFELKSELAKERALVASGTKASNPGKIKNLRKNIARLFTKISLAEKGKAIAKTAKKAGKKKDAETEKAKKAEKGNKPEVKE